MRKVLATRQSRAARTKAKAARGAKVVAPDPNARTGAHSPRFCDFPSALARCVSSVYTKPPATGPKDDGWRLLGPQEEAVIADHLCRVILAECQQGSFCIRVSYPSIAEVIGKELCADPPGPTFVEEWLKRNNYTYLRVQEFIWIVWKS